MLGCLARDLSCLEDSWRLSQLQLKSLAILVGLKELARQLVDWEASLGNDAAFLGPLRSRGSNGNCGAPKTVEGVDRARGMHGATGTLSSRARLGGDGKASTEQLPRDQKAFKGLREP